MENIDSLKRDNKVTVTIFAPDGSTISRTTGTGFHNIMEAIKDAIDKSTAEFNPEDCYFEVANDTTGVAHKYRLNAHGNLKLIV